MNPPSICILIPYFGDLPPWFPLFFDSLRRNSTIDFLFLTDASLQDYHAPNVKTQYMSFDAYGDLVHQRTGLSLHLQDPYKLCDIRPLFGWIHAEELKPYDFYGYADVDVVFGDIRSFYTNELLSKYDVFSTHAHILSGHFSLFRNTRVHWFMFEHIGGWEEKLQAEEYIGLDEMLLLAYQKWSQVIYPGLSFWRKWRLRRGLPQLYMKEQYSTPFTPIPWIDGTTYADQPDTWFYQDGKITNNRDGNRTFLYLHFMNFKSSKYRHDGSSAPWIKSAHLLLPAGYHAQMGVRIDLDGIFPIDLEWFLPCGP